VNLRIGVIVVAVLGLTHPWTLKEVHTKVAGILFDRQEVVKADGDGDGDGDGIEPTPDYVPPEPFIPGANEAVALDAIVGPNTLVNSRELCGGRGNTQSETAMAVSGDVIVVAFNDSRGFYCPAHSTVGWAFSFDGGLTFQDGGSLPGGLTPWSNGDPWLAVGPDGSFYVSGISNNFRGMSISRGTVTADGISWSNPVQATFGSSGTDKEALAIDLLYGSIYMAYDVNNARVEVVRSDDQAATWTSPTVLPPPGGIGAFPLVDATGRLYVTWLAGWPAANQRIFISSSNDFGQTFSEPVLISYVCPVNVLGFSRGQMPAFPSVAIDQSGGKFDGRIYVAFHYACEVPGEAYLSSSDDGGQTWSSLTQVNDDDTTGIHFSPSVSVDPVGNVNVFFYDRRENPGTSTTNLYFAQSTDGGLTFAPNIRVTEVATTWGSIPSDITPNFGDYITSLSVGSDVLVTWADGRNGDPDAYFARLSPAKLIQE
jgi:hypothetical protein